ncbi:VOC family protein [Natrinema sp. H-ect4]|uniref:VOC family protein n=1 Tax=Natrinema sp. H-ect4 TaxID=3242699 RepID=UPI0035A8FD92
MDVLHTAIWVDNIEAQLDFYCDGLGLERTREFDLDGVTNTYVAGESTAEIQFKHDGTERDPKPAGIDHLAVGIDDIDGTVDDLVEHYGSEVVEGPRTVDEKDIRLAFVTAPEGYVVELIETLED